jgi:hypothetical protein
MTLWIPLQPVPNVGGTALLFGSKSQADFALPYWNPSHEQNTVKSAWNRLEERYDNLCVH